MEQISAIYADFVNVIRYEDLPKDIVQQAKKVTLDLIGVSLAGYCSTAVSKTIIDYLVSLGGKAEATVVQTKGKLPAIHAAFANAFCAHALDMDDGHRFAASHPGVVVIPAALAAAELVGASTKTLITGIVVGYEIMIRIGKAIAPSSLSRGFHITGITGPFGAVSAASNIMGLGREKVIAAFGVAGLQAAGLVQVNHEQEGAMIKPINPARAAMSGLLSCILAKRGVKGPHRIFEGEDGYLRAFADRAAYDLLVYELGSVYEILNVYLKLYAACRHVHAPIDAAMKAFEGSHLRVGEIDKIVVKTYSAAVHLAGIKQPKTASAGRFSIPFSVALALVKGSAGADEYSEENILDQTIQRLAERLEMVVSDRWDKAYPQKRGATVIVVSRAGESWTVDTELAKGEPENPLTWEDVSRKFIRNATCAVCERKADMLLETIAKLESIALKDLIKQL